MLKKYILFGVLLGCCLVSGVKANLCMTDYSVLIVLDKDFNSMVKYESPQLDDMNWRVDVNYDTLATYNGIQRNIRGTASCSEFSGSIHDTDVSGAVTSMDKSGTNCWCVMARPATTYPILAYIYSDADSCVVGCARTCADKLRTSYDFRDKFFESVL